MPCYRLKYLVFRASNSSIALMLDLFLKTHFDVSRALINFSIFSKAGPGILFEQFRWVSVHCFPEQIYPTFFIFYSGKHHHPDLVRSSFFYTGVNYQNKKDFFQQSREILSFSREFSSNCCFLYQGGKKQQSLDRSFTEDVS